MSTAWIFGRGGRCIDRSLHGISQMYVNCFDLFILTQQLTISYLFLTSNSGIQIPPTSCWIPISQISSRRIPRSEISQTSSSASTQSSCNDCEHLNYIRRWMLLTLHASRNRIALSHTSRTKFRRVIWTVAVPLPLAVQNACPLYVPHVVFGYPGH